MKLNSSLFLVILLHSLATTAQVGGESVYQFLNISTSARQIALGGEVLTLENDINQPMWNPAVINNHLDTKLAVNYASYLAGINIGSISYAREISRRIGTIHGSVTYLDYGSLIGADTNGTETGNFNANDIAIAIGYAYNLPNTNFYIGSNVKLISSNISSFSSTGIASDIGLLYQSPFKPYSFALVARNMGTQIKSFNGVYERIPFKLAFGGSYRLEHVPLKWYFTLDNLQQWEVAVANPSAQTSDLEGNITEEQIGFIGNALRHFIIGAELFPNRAINVRLGYNFRRSAELKLQNARTFSGISLGFGIKMNRFKFNYAHSKFHSASNTGTFSLEIDLGNSK
jgi:hypothetical protein|tara:strand:- start:501 stop:1529 length:1029 start_codon:yes stop_codon:yes gene_type:complete